MLRSSRYTFLVSNLEVRDSLGVGWGLPTYISKKLPSIGDAVVSGASL